jgi:hypothetical protein
MPTYTNLGIQQIDNGTQAGSWGTITNNNFEYFDTAICGVLPITLSSAINTNLDVANYAPASPDGRNRVLVFSSATNLGAVCNVRITKNSSDSAPYFEGYYFVRNSLNTSDLIIYQGATIPGAANYARIPNGQDAIVLCFGTGIVGVFLQNSQQFTTISGIAGVGLSINTSAASGPALSTTVPAKLTVGPGTYTDNTTAASTTVAHGTLTSLRTSAVAATNSSVTYTRASTLYVENAPTAGSNVTITYSYAAYIANGWSYFGGNVGIGDSSPSYPLTINATGTYPIVATTTSVSGLLLTSTDASEDGMSVTFAKYSASPVDGDDLCYLRFFGRNTATPTPGNIEYARITVEATDVSTGTEDGTLKFAIRTNGALAVSTPALKLDSAGITVPATYGNSVGSPNRSVYVNSSGEYGGLTSSIRYKENIENTFYGLDEVMQLRAVTFNYISDPTAPRSFGFIAEEVDAIGLKELVSYNIIDQPESVHYELMAPLLAKAIQEQQAMIEDLKARVAALGG